MPNANNNHSVFAQILDLGAREKVVMAIILGLFGFTLIAPLFVSAPPPFAGLFFEVCIVLLLLCAITIPRKRAYLALSLFAVAYIAISYVLSLEANTAIRDFLIAYKPFFYIAVSALIAGSGIVQLRQLQRVHLVWLGVFAIVYSVELAFGLAESSRPNVFVENNFEILALSLLHVLIFSQIQNHRIILHGLYLFIVLLSGSLSGMAIAGFLTILLFLKFRPKQIMLLAGVLLVSFALLSLVVYQRYGDDIMNVDRIRFFSAFLSEAQNWSLVEYLFGTRPLTPLSQTSCTTLSFYKDLFSTTHPEICYSVILHLLSLRLVFDHGIAGLLFVFGALYFLIPNHISIRYKIAIVGAIALSALSVSAYNNSMVAFVFALILASSTGLTTPSERH